jgi:hypothetical protein
MTCQHDHATRPCSHDGPGIYSLKYGVEMCGRFPGVGSLGTYVCRTTESGNPSVHGNDRATDIRPVSRAQGDAIAALLIRNAAALGVQFIAWWGRYLECDDNFAGSRIPSNRNQHTDHVHTEINKYAARTLTKETALRILKAPVSAAPQQEVRFVASLSSKELPDWHSAVPGRFPAAWSPFSRDIFLENNASMYWKGDATHPPVGDVAIDADTRRFTLPDFMAPGKRIVALERVLVNSVPMMRVWVEGGPVFDFSINPT